MVTLEEAPAGLRTGILGRARPGCEGGGDGKAWGGQGQDGGTAIQGGKGGRKEGSKVVGVGSASWEREELAIRRRD